MQASASAIVVFSAIVLGAVIGSFLNVVIHRVPQGVALTGPSRCPRCASLVRPWQNVPVVSWIALRGRCAACAASISVRYPLVEVGTAAAFGAVAWWSTASQSGDSAPWGPAGATSFSWVAVTVAYLYFASITIALALIDLDTHRLPNAIVLPSYLVVGALFVLACLLGADWAALLRAAIGGAILYVFYFVLRLIRPAGMGGGDVKLAGVVGMCLAWLGWTQLIVGAFAAFLLGGVFSLALLLTRRAGRRTAIPFGPWILAGAWVGILAGDTIARWYIGLFFVA